MSTPWMPLYVADYLQDTNHLSTVEHGAYLLLIMHYWSKGKLPVEPERLARIARLPLEQWSSIASSIAEFFDEQWQHARIDQELADARLRHERRAEAGRNGGKSKALKQKASIATPMLQQKSGNDVAVTTTTTIEEEEREKTRERALSNSEEGSGWSPTPEDREHAASAGFTETEIANLVSSHADYLATHGLHPADPGAAWRNFLRTRKPRKPVSGAAVTGALEFIEEGTEEFTKALAGPKGSLLRQLVCKHPETERLGFYRKREPVAA